VHPTEVPLRSDLSKRPIISEPEPEEEVLKDEEEEPVPIQVLSQ
jgi:hypothetical protein